GVAFLVDLHRRRGEQRRLAEAPLLGEDVRQAEKALRRRSGIAPEERQVLLQRVARRRFGFREAALLRQRPGEVQLVAVARREVASRRRRALAGLEALQVVGA